MACNNFLKTACKHDLVRRTAPALHWRKPQEPPMFDVQCIHGYDHVGNYSNSDRSLGQKYQSYKVTVGKPGIFWAVHRDLWLSQFTSATAILFFILDANCSHTEQHHQKQTFRRPVRLTWCQFFAMSAPGSKELDEDGLLSDSGGKCGRD